MYDDCAGACVVGFVVVFSSVEVRNGKCDWEFQFA